LGIAQFIENTSGWEAFGFSMLLLVLIALAVLALYVGGDQIANGYHMYG